MSADERGTSAGLTALVAMLVVVAVGIATALLVAAGATAQARRATDLAALAAVQGGCAEAERVAVANEASLLSCEVGPDGVAAVTAAAPTWFRLPGVPEAATASARAART